MAAATEFDLQPHQLLAQLLRGVAAELVDQVVVEVADLFLERVEGVRDRVAHVLGHERAIVPARLADVGGLERVLARSVSGFTDFPAASPSVCWSRSASSSFVRSGLVAGSSSQSIDPRSAII